MESSAEHNQTHNNQSDYKSQNKTASIDIASIVNSVAQEIKFSHANILIAGKTGVGKSSLINATFNINTAETGCGKPATQEAIKYSKSGVPISIIDSKGLELEKYKETLNEIEELIKRLQMQDSEKHIHLAWVCITQDSGRIEDGEIKLIELLSQYKIPVMVVITKAKQKEPELKKAIQDILKDKVKNVVAVRAIGDEIEDDDGNMKKTKPLNLKELIEISFKYIPAGQRAAFVSAQKVSLELKKKEIDNIINVAAIAAGGVATTPIPFSDAVLIAPIQIGMIIKITGTYGISIEDGALTALASSVVGCTATTLIGRSFVGNLLKFIPGVGTVAGDVINATAAGALTKGLGSLYSNIVLELYKEALDNDTTEVSVANIIERMKLEWSNKSIF